MTRTDLTNLLAVLVALAAAAIAAGWQAPARDVEPVRPAPASGVEELAIVTLADGREAILDATRHPVPLIEYGRIVSASTAADWLLLELAEPGRVLAYTEQSVTRSPWRYRYAGARTITSVSGIETLLALRPDLVILDDVGDPRRIARLREHGLVVMSVGDLRGVASLREAALRLGAVLGRPERAAVLADRFERDLRGLARHVPASSRPRALYVSAYAGKLFGGTVGTTYHEILELAGLTDAAAGAYEPSPEYTPEMVLMLDPDVLITRHGTGSALCRVAGLHRLRACQRAGGVIELDGFMLDDPGLGLIEATEALHGVVHGRARR